MTNLFLKVNKDLFKLGLNPTEILVLAQVMEFDSNTGNCFISDKALAASFGVSEKTISRTIKALEDKGYITRDTKNIKGGKERIMKPNQKKIKAALTKDNLTIDCNNNGQNDYCTMDKLTIDNRQNDFIKDNIKDNLLKDNINESNSASALIDSSKAYPTITVKDLVANNIAYELIENSSNLIIIKATGAIARVV